jgi:hypothetical protein
MQLKTPLLALVAAAAIAGCDRETFEGQGPYDPNANATANAAEVKLPPAIVASHPYRCKDNSLIRIDWLSDGTVNSARVTPEGGATVSLAQAEAGGPYTEAVAPAADPAAAAPAAGATLTGDPQARTVTFNGKTCNR